MFDNVGEALEGVASQFGLTFFLAGFLPLLVGVIANQYLLLAAPWDLFPGVTEPLLGIFSGPLLSTLVVAFALALVIIPINPFLIKLFEGLLPGLSTLLAPLAARGRRHHQERLYAAVHAERANRLGLLARYEMTGEYDPAADSELQQKLQALHSQQEQIEPTQTMPYDVERLTPTSFGNAWAVMEEYPLVRYGMDGMFYWPYVRAILLTENPALVGQIDGQKLLVDVAVNMAFVAAVLAIEGAVFAAARAMPGLLLVTAAGVLLFALFYAAGVQYVRTMARLITQSFDLYRWRLLDQFGLARPADLDDEYWLWVRLEAFLRRGEPFYFDMLARKGEIEEEAPAADGPSS